MSRPKEKPAEFFVDRSLGKSIVESLRNAGLTVHSLAEVYGEKRPRLLAEEVWLRDAGEYDSIVLTAVCEPASLQTSDDCGQLHRSSSRKPTFPVAQFTARGHQCRLSSRVPVLPQTPSSLLITLDTTELSRGTITFIGGMVPVGGYTPVTANRGVEGPTPRTGTRARRGR